MQAVSVTPRLWRIINLLSLTPDRLASLKIFYEYLQIMPNIRLLILAYATSL